VNALILHNASAVTIEVQPSAVQERNRLLSDASAIADVQDAFTQDMAVGTLRELKGLLKAVEDSRQNVKAPVLELGKTIDTKAREFVQQITAEANRIQALLTKYTVEERKKAEAAERARQTELRRIEEEKRKAAEAQFMAETKAEEQAAAQQAQVLKQQEIAVKQAPAVVPTKTAGMIVRDVWRFEVTDAHALYAANRNLIKLVPDSMAINRAISGGMKECPGLRIWQETQTGVRT
jgi:hypothetical protein